MTIFSFKCLLVFFGLIYNMVGYNGSIFNFFASVGISFKSIIFLIKNDLKSLIKNLAYTVFLQLTSDILLSKFFFRIKNQCVLLTHYAPLDIKRDFFFFNQTPQARR